MTHTWDGIDMCTETVIEIDRDEETGEFIEGPPMDEIPGNNVAHRGRLWLLP